MMTLANQLHRQGYRQQPGGLFTKRVEFNIPRQPDYILVKLLTRNRDGLLIRGERARWMRKAKIPVDTVNPL